MIKAIIFDFGNVIATFDNDLFLKRISKYTDTSALKLKHLIYKKSKLPEQYEKGQINSYQFYKKIVGLCNLDVEKDQFRDDYTKIFTPIPETIDLIHKLKPNYKIGLLSSTSEWDFEFGFKPIFDVSIFDSITLTYEQKVNKPDIRLFEDAMSKLKVRPDEAVFIDDLSKTIKVANSLDMHGILYTDHENLIESLNNLEVEI